MNIDSESFVGVAGGGCRLHQRVHDLCDRSEQERQERLYWRRGCNASAFIDRKTDRSSRSTNWRMSGRIKSFTTTWLTFVTRMLCYRARLRRWLGTKIISWRFLNVAAVFSRGRDLVVMVRAVTTDIKRRMRTYPARQLDRVRIDFAM